jgi:hypothetical protein
MKTAELRAGDMPAGQRRIIVFLVWDDAGWVISTSAPEDSLRS